MSFVKLIEFSDKKIREEFGDYYIISKDRVENIRNNFDRLREDKQKLKDALRELAEAAEWRDECGVFKDYCWDYAEWLPITNYPKYLMAKRHLEAAENAYQAALKVAKEG